MFDPRERREIEAIVRRMNLGADVPGSARSALQSAAIGVTVQAYDADLTAIAALTSAANKVPYATGAGTWTLADLTPAGRAILDDADAPTQRTTLGLGTMAVETATDYAKRVGSYALTEHNASLGAQTLLTGGAGTAGTYRASFYILCSTAGDPTDNVIASLSWNDGAARVQNVPIIRGNGVAGTAVILNSTTSYGQGTMTIQVAASQNVTFTATLDATGAPKYKIVAVLGKLL
jgi:hypothetical protein